ncbi:MAG TPA: glycosyltransferase family 4 protein [Acidimicrobiales bacterium]|nr:glycosyltransferase family 4 protein [Acidimicrobiales bacterium]
MKGIEDAAGAVVAAGSVPTLNGVRPPSIDIGPRQPHERLAILAANAGLRRVQILAWRDLEHPEAGGSEVHAARIAERWAAAGIDVQLTTSRAPGAPRRSQRDGYRTLRPAGRYGIFPAAAAAALAGRRSRPDGVVEIWNGMPFFSPVWAPHPRVVFLHHVHGGMWDLVLPRALARAGKWVERRLAPPLYAGTPVVTLSESSRRTIVATLGLDPALVSVVPPGVDPRFHPGGPVEKTPLVVAVGRLVPYKRFDLLVDLLVRVRARHPDLQAVVAGEGSERRRLEALVAAHHAEGWLHLPGRVTDEALVDLYRRAWVVLSTSAYEGWGLTISEAAACGTPAIASPIDGHLDAIHDGESGLLAEPGAAMEAALNQVLTNRVVRRRLQVGARNRARELTWDQTALGTLQVLTADRTRRSGPVAAPVGS